MSLELEAIALGLHVQMFCKGSCCLNVEAFVQFQLPNGPSLTREGAILIEAMTLLTHSMFKLKLLVGILKSDKLIFALFFFNVN
jgi:hypothetical protein